MLSPRARALPFLLTSLLITQCCGNSVDGWIETVRVNLLQEILDNPYLRSPIAVILDLDPRNVINFKSLWFETAIQGLPDRNVTFYAVNGGVAPPVQHSSAKLSGVLSSLHPASEASVEEEAAPSPLLAAVWTSTSQLPFDSAVVVITRSKPSDADIVNTVAEKLIRKRARLYVIWTGDQDSSEDVLLDAAFLTGGAFYYTETNVVLRTRMLRHENDDLDQKIINRKRVTGRLESSFVVYEGVQSFRIRIIGNLTRADVVNPRGQTRNLLTLENDGEIDFLVANNEIHSGAWLLLTESTNNQTYDIFVNKEVYDDSTESTTDDIPDSIASETVDRLPRSAETEISPPKPAKLLFPDDVVTTNESLKEIPTMGQQKSITPVIVPIIVELASGSSLELLPGTTATLQYEITNNLNIDTPATFTASGSGMIVQSVQPTQAYLSPSRTIRIQVTISPLPQQNGGSGILVFTVFGGGRTTNRRAQIYFTSEITSDTWDPKMTYEYKGDCKQHDEPATCSNGQWSIVATVKDEDSGLLKVLSEPYGLSFQSEFVAGTKSPVTVTYSETCCKPKVDIWAEDLRGNYKRKSFDIFHQGLLDGEIAAIVVGVLLLILLIVLIIFIVMCCRKRRRDKIILPRHRANSK